MAQPFFDQHPLEEYFRHTGETAEPMPGGSPEFNVEEDDTSDNEDLRPQGEFKLYSYLVRAIEVVNDLIQSSSCSSHENSFAERFKYDVISSSLLSSSLAAPMSAVRRSFSPELPGKLDTTSSGSEDEHLSATNTSPGSTLSASPLGSQLPIVLVSIAVIVLSTGYITLAMIPLAAAAYVYYFSHSDGDKSHSTTQTLESLNELIAAGNVWDSAVNEAIVLIENEERSIFYGPTSPQAPSSALRITLQSSLHTTQTQCDNVRQLMSAVTDPASLAHLAEMYAPPSPIRHPLSLTEAQRSPSPSSTMRPFSHPSGSWRPRTTSLPSETANKRATWNGSYAALAGSGSPTAHLLSRKKQHRRSDVISLFQPTTGAAPLAISSAPVSPQPDSAHPRGLEVLEEEEVQELESKEYFGAAALDLQRKRRSGGLESFGVPPPSYTPPRSPIRGSHGATAQPPLSLLAPTITGSSRFTSVHTTRHPLSLSGLHLALQGALASKRYTCSHLLALQFDEDEDDSYWENVRSIMALLTSTFSDASSRLLEALNDAEKRRIKDERPTPPRGNTPSPQGKDGCTSPLRNEYSSMRRMSEMFSFAPMPSNMSRLAGHIDAISTALNDARSHMEECVSTLRNPAVQLPGDGPGPSVQDHPAFQAYDRLRKELGFALRECERGRERLLDIIAPRAVGEAEDEDASPHTPGLKHDSGSECSERSPASPNVHGDSLGITLSYGREEQGEDLDDATAHLLLTASSQHLPPAGAEQVFEAESGNSGSYTRARSKLSREDRIRIMKARRASGVPIASISSLASAAELEQHQHQQPRRERWGPGGEVVQELKDVIWKVGEKKRRMVSQHQQREPQRPDQQEQISQREETADLEAMAQPEGPHSLAPVLVPESMRETSILIDVDAPSPTRSGGAEDDEEEPGLAYLDSPPMSPIDGSVPDEMSQKHAPLDVAATAIDLDALLDSRRTTVLESLADSERS